MSLQRYSDGAWLGGVCTGIARRIGVDAWVIRTALVLAALFSVWPNILMFFAAIAAKFPKVAAAAFLIGTHWFFIVPYVVLWIFMPKGVAAGDEGR